ncbi:MAG: hypothetical protein U0441_11950 [Polyangiaceae bacterium]
MTPTKRLRLVLAVLLSAAGGSVWTGCNDILGIGEPIPASGGSTGGAAGATSTSGSTAGGTGGTTSTSGSGATSTGGGGGGGSFPCDPNETPSDGVFVSPNGDDMTGDGSATLPVKTIARALDLANSQSKRAIHLAQGTYPAPLTVTTLPAGPAGEAGAFVIDSGWVATGAAWTHDCSAGARAKTVLASPSNVGATIALTDAWLTLRTLTVATKAAGATTPDADGESCYGIVATGSGTLRLEDVEVHAGKGGDGGAATLHVDGPTATCNPDGLSTCAQIGVGTSGGMGDTGMAGAPSSGGMFSADGYHPVAAGDGDPGTPGQNGGPGAAGEQSNSCWAQGCSGAPVPPCNTGFCGNLGNVFTDTAGTGRCGCGGQGGAAGKSGRGGGASVGLYAYGVLDVQVDAGKILASDGGAGTAGAEGLPGATGTLGAVGTPKTCFGSCASVSVGGNQCQCQQPGTKDLKGGAKGGDGGTGGMGGKGGGGSGGPSISLVRGAGATITHTGTPLVFGTAGSGADGASSGMAQEELSL